MHSASNPGGLPFNATSDPNSTYNASEALQDDIESALNRELSEENEDLFENEETPSEILLRELRTQRAQKVKNKWAKGNPKRRDDNMRLEFTDKKTGKQIDLARHMDFPNQNTPQGRQKLQEKLAELFKIVLGPTNSFLAFKIVTTIY